MLSRSQAKLFFVGGTFLASAAFLVLTVHSFQEIPRLSNQAAMDAQVVRGKHLWDVSNCMGCHTLLGEGGYYAPELTQVYARRGEAFIKAMLKDPQGMYPGERKMVQYDFTDEEIDAFLAFFRWIGEMDLNGFPPEPQLFSMAAAGANPVIERQNRPQVYNQMCIACHSLGGQGGNVGPALDGVGDRMSQKAIEEWLDNPQKIKPGTLMPDLPLSEEGIRELSAFLSTLRGAPGAAAKPTAPAENVEDANP